LSAAFEKREMTIGSPRFHLWVPSRVCASLTERVRYVVILSKGAT
jgi:hypothetical protein